MWMNNIDDGVLDIFLFQIYLLCFGLILFSTKLLLSQIHSYGGQQWSPVSLFG
jgi:hypothetical protein